MTKLLSDEKIEQLFKSMHGFPYPNDLYAFARAIEAAVLEAQKQKPVARIERDGHYIRAKIFKRYMDLPAGTKLYADALLAASGKEQMK